MENKTLSVIIPNYNKSIYVKDTIESILRQSYRPNEIIIVDDASTDVSKQIINDFKQKYPDLIKVYYFTKNQGVQKARSYGVEKATSEYITFIDSDDFYFDQKKLEKEIKIASPNRIVYSYYCLYDNVTKKVTIPKNNRWYFWFFRSNQIYCYVNMKYMSSWPFAFIVTKDAFNKIGGYDFPYNYFEDLDLLIRFSISGLRPYLLNCYGLAIRSNATDISHLSNQSEKYNDVVGLLSHKYKKDISLLNKFNGAMFNFFERAKSIIKKAIGSRE